MKKHLLQLKHVFFNYYNILMQIYTTDLIIITEQSVVTLLKHFLKPLLCTKCLTLIAAESHSTNSNTLLSLLNCSDKLNFLENSN